MSHACTTHVILLFVIRVHHRMKFRRIAKVYKIFVTLLWSHRRGFRIAMRGPLSNSTSTSGPSIWCVDISHLVR